jgi:hypothetical protein
MFTVYASPYTPEFNGYAFAYGKDDMRFLNIPSGVDILMTHGPPMFLSQPKYTLDVIRMHFTVGARSLRTRYSGGDRDYMLLGICMRGGVLYR